MTPNAILKLTVWLLNQSLFQHLLKPTLQHPFMTLSSFDPSMKHHKPCALLLAWIVAVANTLL